VKLFFFLGFQKLLHFNLSIAGLFLFSKLSFLLEVQINL